MNKGNQCYCKCINESPVIFADPYSSHKEADQNFPMHAVHANQLQTYMCGRR